MTSRTVSRLQPAAALQRPVVSNDEVDERGEYDAGQGELDYGDSDEDCRKHYSDTTAPLSVMRPTKLRTFTASITTNKQ